MWLIPELGWGCLFELGAALCSLLSQTLCQGCVGKRGQGEQLLFCVSGPAGKADVSDGFCLMVSFLLGPGYYR